MKSKILRGMNLKKHDRRRSELRREKINEEPQYCFDK